ncbi:MULTISPECIES: SH3 domain-containing protein [Streptomyces]|nr:MULTISPECIES: SH3 domain-containing protein [Streptomyces]MCG0062790.1 SH3 domain-containing protein [Streptomyces tricolor]
MLGTLALPMLSTTPATAAPAAAASTATSIGTPCPDLPPLPYKVHASAVTIRSKATTKSTAVGVLYKSHKFTVHKKSGNWLYITDKSTGVKGWVSGTYVYRDTRMCLD